MVFDLSAGLFLVALSEELIFRYLAQKAFTTSAAKQYMVATVLFGLIHAPQGPLLVIATALSGALYLWLYRRAGTLAAPVLAHFLVDFAIFSGLMNAVVYWLPF